MKPPMYDAGVCCSTWADFGGESVRRAKERGRGKMYRTGIGEYLIIVVTPSKVLLYNAFSYSLHCSTLWSSNVGVRETHSADTVWRGAMV